jgi:hypothetical protein
MSAHTPDVDSVIDAMANRKVPAIVNTLGFAAIAVGVAAAGYGFAVAGAAWTWGAILVGILYLLALGQGGVMFSVILTGTWGRWGRPLKRIGECFAFVLPVAWLLMVVFLLGGIGLYPWNPDTFIESGYVSIAPHSPEAYPAKEIWLSKGFFTVRLILGVAFLIGLNFLYIRASMRPDMIYAKERLNGKVPSWWSWFIGTETSVDEAVTASNKVQSFMFPFIGFAYALTFSMVAFDLVMSLAPWWFANMFGGWFFVSSIWVALATIGLVSMIARDWLKLGEFITPTVTHDLGKLMLALCMFWGYTTFAQLLPIWYTDMPEETDFLMIRMMLPQWSWLTQTVAITCFVAPFTILLSRGIKKMRWPFAAICCLIMVGIFLERTLLVMPSVYMGDTFPVGHFIVVSLGVWFGCLGIFTVIVSRVLASVPPLVVTDPHLEPHPWDVHVHSLDEAH